jgi:hypothetical protein
MRYITINKKVVILMSTYFITQELDKLIILRLLGVELGNFFFLDL